MKTLYLDLENGISGDIFLGGLCGLGLDLAPFEQKLIEAGLVTSVRAEHLTRDHFQGVGLLINEAGGQPLRHLEEMFEAVKALQLSDQVWAHIRHALMRLAEAEALAHGISLDEVHFHEVGGVDTIVDVAGAFWGLAELGVERVVASPVPWFEGTAETCHGTISLPAPATLRLLEGKPIANPTGKLANWEIITPTGALLLDCLVDEFGPFPEGILKRQSLAFGSNPRGKGMRAFLVDAAPVGQGERADIHLEAVWVLESHIDHLSGEDLGNALEVLMAEGALDVLFTPGITKKNRPGGSLRVICAENDLARVEETFFRETHTLGIRRRKEIRRVLPRSESEIGLEGVARPLAAKTYTVDGRTYTRPEFEALKQAALESGRSVLEIRSLPNSAPSHTPNPIPGKSGK